MAGIAHCIGSLFLKPAHRTTPAEWSEVLEVNLSSAFGVTMAVPELMAGGGSVVFCSSVAASLGLANHEAIRRRQGRAGRAGACGGRDPRAPRHPFPLRGTGAGRQSDDRFDARARRHARSGRQAETRRGGSAPRPTSRRAIAFLLDPANAWIDGQVLGVDGGYGVVRPLA